MLEARPKLPTMTTSFGLPTSVDEHHLPYTRGKGGSAPVALKKRSMASMKIEKQRASRKTPLTRAPSTSARCQP
jgi:hypothetical protein